VGAHFFTHGDHIFFEFLWITLLALNT